MIAVIDYGAGNLGSVYKALRYIGAEVEVTADSSIVDRADAVVLPGVGAFGHCMSGLTQAGLRDSTLSYIASQRPFLGICVGLQMLFEQSGENPETPGLGALRGSVVKFAFGNGVQATAASGVQEDYVPQSPLTHQIRYSRTVPGSLETTERLKVPHMGWNEVEHLAGARLFEGVPQKERFYFVHSYYPIPLEKGVASAWCDYGGRFDCAVEWGNIYGTQFHPEKSGAAGLQILRNFVSLAS
jgi:glutamine amidotransferase